MTETLDDDGLPYALSHLIFAGSKEYPYSGILNRWADRCLGSNINAYCLKDRTYFTMNAAGSEGFLSLMPKYLEHILDPALKVKIFTLLLCLCFQNGNVQIVENITNYHAIYFI